MQKIYKLSIALIITIWSTTSHAITPDKDSLRLEVLLNKSMLKEIPVKGTFVNSLEITSQRLIVLSTQNQFYLLGWGGMAPMGNETISGINSFAFTPDSVLMVIRGNELCCPDSAGNLSALFKLPHNNMGISSGKYTMYIYDRDNTNDKNIIYALTGGGRYSKLLDVPSPISSVIEIDNCILFSTRNAVIKYDLQSKEMKTIAILPEGNKVRSLAVNPSNNRIFFSTDQKVFAINDSMAVMITDKIGGTIRYLNGLIVFDPESQLLIRFVGVEDAISSGRRKAAETEEIPGQNVKTNADKKINPSDQHINILTNSSIIDLHNNGLPDEIIINLINRNKVDFNISMNAVIELSNNNVSSKVIMEMKNAMEKQHLDSK